MSTKAAKAIEALRSRDVTAYREARAAYFTADSSYQVAGQMIGAEGKPH